MTDKLIEIYRAMGEMEAQVIRGKLESQGIPSILQSDSAPSVHMVPFTRLGWTRVMVPEKLAETARSIIEEVTPEETQDESC
jgi:hypothetical protein